MTCYDSMSRGRFAMAFLGREADFAYTVSNTYACRLEFSVAGVPYTFEFTRWSGRGLKKLIPLFFEYTQRDEDTFGRIQDTDDGMVFSMSSEQKLNVVLQATKDALQTINLIFDAHGRGIVDYCIWFREKFDSAETYARVITLVACHNVVHSELLAPRVTWELVTFPESEV